MAGHSLLKDRIRHKVGIGEIVSVFHDPWLPANLLYIETEHVQEMQDITVESLLDEMGEREVDILLDLFIERDINCILSIPRSKFPVRDEVYWEGDNKGMYTVKRGYWHLKKDSTRPNAATPFPYSKIWQINAPPPKVRNLLWHVVKNVLPTKDNVASK